jgi:hypothetical protein
MPREFVDEDSHEAAGPPKRAFLASSLFGVGGNDRSCLPTDVFRFG